MPHRDSADPRTDQGAQRAAANRPAEQAEPPGPAGLRALLERWGFSWQGLRDNRRGEWWLIAQLLLISAHLLPAWPAHGAGAWPPLLQGLGWGVLALGLILALQAFLDLGASLTPLPEPMADAALITRGAYGRCRHPLYQAILICSLGVSLALGSLLHLALLCALIAVLGGKARREEQRLLQIHPGYGAYRASTAAIVPALPWLDWR